MAAPKNKTSRQVATPAAPLSLSDYLQKILTARVYDVANETPLDIARNLSARLGNQVLLKREDTQPVFSFKLRGAYNKMVNLSAVQLERGVICALAGIEDRDRLIDHVILVGLQVLAPALLDQLDDPARIEVHAEADAAAVLREVLDRQTQTPRAGRPQHQPVRPAREELVRQRVAEDLVIGAEVVDRHARLRRAGRPARLEDEHRLAGESLGDPPLHRAAAQRFVFERAEALQVRKRLDFLARIPPGLRREVEPERTTGRGIEMPVDDLAHPRVERNHDDVVYRW